MTKSHDDDNDDLFLRPQVSIVRHPCAALFAMYVSSFSFLSIAVLFAWILLTVAMSEVRGMDGLPRLKLAGFEVRKTYV